MRTPESGETFRFGDFVLDVAGCELRRDHRRVKLGRQAMDILILLVLRRGQLVRRSDIVDRLWGQDVFVDVETGVNTAISKIRQALRDSSDTPRYIETVPGRGYRFVAQVEVLSAVLPSHLPLAAHPFPVAGEAEPLIVSTTGLPDRDSSQVAELALTARAAPVAKVPPARLRPAGWTVAAISLMFIAAAIGLATWTRVGGVSVERVTLAVLPFDNVGNDPEREYLAAGLTQETSASLAQIDPQHLTVKGRTWRYKGTTKTAGEIGQELSVDYLVESTLRSEGERLRVTVTVMRVKDQEHVWSQSYERETTSLLGLEQELSRAIAEQVRGRLSPDHSKDAPRQTQSPDAYDAYLRGRYLESRRTPVTNAGALQQYERAIALDPNYALAWSSLAFTYAGSVINGDARPLDMWPRAREAAARAVRANPNLAEAQFVVGYVNWLMDWDWKAAEAAFRLAIRLDGSNAAAYRTLGHALSQSGRHAEAAVAMRRARELEPLEAIHYALSAQVAFQAREYGAAVEYARRAVLMDSELWIGYVELGFAFEQLGQPDLALAALTDAMRLSGGNSKAVAQRGYILAKTGRTDEAREVLSKLELDARQRYVPPYAMALVNAGLGQRDAVFEWLNRAYAARDVHLIYLPVDPKWDAYRADPRFVALLAQCRFTNGLSPAK